MTDKLLLWNIYEVSSQNSSLNGVKLRGRIRKLGLNHRFNVLAENTEDAKNSVRFAVINDNGKEIVEKYITKIISDVKIECVLRQCSNPVLSKLKVNIESRYKL